MMTWALGSLTSLLNAQTQFQWHEKIDFQIRNKQKKIKMRNHYCFVSWLLQVVDSK